MDRTLVDAGDGAGQSLPIGQPSGALTRVTSCSSPINLVAPEMELQGTSFEVVTLADLVLEVPPVPKVHQKRVIHKEHKSGG